MNEISAIRIGVTGHRVLRDEAAFEALVTKLITQGAEPSAVVSSLAEGADRVVARVLRRRGARLEAVLPLTLDDYLEDFDTEESRKEFQELLTQCRDPTFLRTRSVRDESVDPAQQVELRNAAYEAAGRYLVDHCDVLFALWDGQPSRGRGGTAEIVAYAREQRRPVIRIWDGRCTIL